jgi:uncharacterized membrane protein
MKIRWRSEIFSWAVIAGMFLLAALSWSAAPDSIPIHWNIQGQVDNYAGKAVGLLLLPCTALGIYLMFLVIPRIDPSRADYGAFGKAFGVKRLSTLVVLAVCEAVLLLWIRGIHVSVGTVMPLAIGGLFMIIGNYMGKIRPNWFVGIRTPWTLMSRHVWAKTHRMGGWVFIASGALVILAAIFFNTWVWWVLLATGAGGSVWAFVYSYLAWRTAPDRLEGAK